MITSEFPFLGSQEAASPNGVWAWAKQLVTALQKSRINSIDTLDLTGKAGYKLVVRADENGFELVP